MDVQTDTYLEELTGRTTEFEAETQTDAALDRHDDPLWMPASVGFWRKMFVWRMIFLF